VAGTLGDLKTRILYETNKSGADFDYGVTNAIVSAIIYMEQHHPWMFVKQAFFTIDAGTNFFTFPADFNELIDAKYAIVSPPFPAPLSSYVYYGVRQGFTPLPYDDLNSLFTNGGQTGYPTQYATLGNIFYVYPITSSDTPVLITYHYKDEVYPEANNEVSIWFGDQTIDALRNKALEIFYRDTLQSPEIANTYVAIYQDYIDTIKRKNSSKTIYNILSI
jgi:hypothetical protein